MLCRQCGASIDDSSRFCKSCGTGTAIGVGQATAAGTESAAAVSAAATEPVAPAPVAPAPVPRRQVYAIAGGAIVAGIVAAAVIVYMHTKSAPATPSTAAASTGAANAPAAADASADQYRWTGLTEDQIQAERSALDAAITHWEQTARAPAAGAQGDNSPGVRPAATPDT